MSALAQLREAESSVWDALPCAALLLGPDGVALRANRAFAEFTGLSADAWLDALSDASRQAQPQGQREVAAGAQRRL